MSSEENIAHFKSRASHLESQLANRIQQHQQEYTEIKKAGNNIQPNSKLSCRSCFFLQKLRTYRQLITKLRYKLEMANFKEDELEAKNAALQDCSVPNEEFRKVQTQLQNVLHQHEQFKAYVGGLAKSPAMQREVSAENFYFRICFRLSSTL